MSDAVLVALIALVPIVTAALTSYTTYRLRRADKATEREEARIEKREDWARQDEVAERLLKSTTVVNEKLDTIHTLVNSNMTAAMQSEHDAIVREVAMMREVIAMKEKATGVSASAEAIAAVNATEARLAELASQLQDRAAATLAASGATKVIVEGVILDDDPEP